MLLDGKKLANEIQADIQIKVASLRGRKPGLAVILVGENPASQSYVKSKNKACAAVGILSTTLTLPSTIAESDLLKEIEKLNRDPAVDGILVQLPLPKHIDEKIVTAFIDPCKDIDGFHPLNVGKMLLGEEGGFLPCTPYGIQVLMEKYKIPVEGKHVVILGRSNIVGKPLAAILMQKKPHCNATVTVAHSQSEHLNDLARSADILVAAIGRPHFVKKEMVKKGAAVIDVGINRIETGKLVGDVDFDEVSQVAGSITPVPGGIGPMTIAMLLQNTLASFLKLAIVLFLLTSCAKTEQKDPCTHFEGKAMTLPYHITVGQKLSQKEQRAVFEVIEKTFAEVHDTFDNWNPDSEISRLNASPQETLIPLSPPLQDLLTLCDQMVALSGGRFDPTVEPLAKIWRESRKKKETPSTDALQVACDALGWNHISIHNGIFKKDNSFTRLDLCGVSKGLCIDWIVERLQKLGIKNLVAEWAGEIRAVGHHPESRDWLVRITPAITENQKPMAPIALRNCAVATSSNPFFQIIDPLTASPIEKTEYSVASSTVIAPTCALADALATASLLFSSRKEAESWAQEVVELHPEVRFWILSFK
jgi:methylenetetrahydrofolate dehydrogenase (NADP+) / methenyltetrahydrofolate cyclohydrolase